MPFIPRFKSLGVSGIFAKVPRVPKVEEELVKK
jgi:hypothetical protein